MHKLKGKATFRRFGESPIKKIWKSRQPGPAERDLQLLSIALLNMYNSKRPTLETEDMVRLLSVTLWECRYPFP